MKKQKRLIAFLLAITIILSISNLSSIPVSAAFYTKTISDSSTISNILNLVKQNNGQEMYNKMYYIFYQSQFAAAYNKKFPYPNSGSSHNSVVDNGTTYKLEGSSRGCYLYADYVSKYVYGFGSWSSKCKSVWINQTAGTMTAQDVKNTVMTHAQAGEHIYVAGNVHSVSFVSYDNNGFYYTDYSSDSNPYIYIHYTTWENFKNECNSKRQRACLLNFNLTPNNSTNTNVTISSQANKNTISDTNAILWGKVDKPTNYAVTKIGIKIRKDGESYAVANTKIENPSRDYVGSSYMEPYYNMNTELNLKLTHTTKYFYKFYAVVNGKEYWSEEYSFSTTGSHSYGSWTTTKSATCTSDGKKQRKCSCGQVQTETISALGHNYSTNWTTDVPSTCSQTGSKSKHCSRCSSKTDVTTIAKTAHKYGAWEIIITPKCMTAGEKQRKCSCGNTQKESISALEHEYSSSWTVDRKATCVTNGEKSQHCYKCNAKTNITVIKALGHSWNEWETVQEPTTTKKGISERKCENCSKKEQRSIAKLSEDGHKHNFGKWLVENEPTCSADGKEDRKCTICGEIEERIVVATGHHYDNFIIVTPATETAVGKRTKSCTVCGDIVEEEIPMFGTETPDDTSSEPTTYANTDTTTDDKDKESNNWWIWVVATVVLLGGAVATLVIIKKKTAKQSVK